MDEDLFELTKVVNQDIVDIINTYGLNKKSRRRDLVYKRYYLYYVLHYKRHLTISMTGMYFNRNHSTISIGIKKHEHWWNAQDKSYLQAIYPLPEVLAGKLNLGCDQFKIDCTYIDEEISKISITGHFNWKDLENLPDVLTKNQLLNLLF